jgi:hypothetical protein
LKRTMAFIAAFALVMGALTLTACHRSSHTSVSTYEYREEGPADRPYQGEVIYEPPPSEYRMVAPGEMRAPGQMVPPGQPVVDPNRRP